jgi:hypothetical protein
MKNNYTKTVLVLVVIVLLAIIGYVALMKKPTPVNPPVTTPAASVTYINDQYGFSIALPDSWKGYTIITSEWEGRDVNTGAVTDHGPILTLRHPDWTVANPREDMPIMVFTPSQWTLIQNETMSVGAAPIPPSLLGKNSQYILALPARYNFDYKTGYEEVDQLVHTLVAFEPK